MLKAPDVSLEDILEAIEQEPPSKETKEIRRIVKRITEGLLKKDSEYVLLKN